MEVNFYLTYPQWIKELNLEGPLVPKFLVGTMADMKNAERDKGKDIPTKRFVRIYLASNILPTK